MNPTHRAADGFFRFYLKVCTAAVCMLVCINIAYAWDQPGPSSGSVKLIETTYFPDIVVFQIDVLVANCPARAWLKYEGGASFPRGSDEAKRSQSVRGTYSALLTAFGTGKRVTVYARNTSAQDPYCVVEFLYIND